ncbi:MAG: threonine/serine dehydratase [Fimbriimonadaceae bacterium]|nr:threonine/serine dehydratase [Alphaproteobacteria bacterium]
MDQGNMEKLPDFADVEAARARIHGVAVRTPLLEFPVLNAALGGRILVKPETLQRTGSFKFRGAYNKISLIAAERPDANLVTFSSGNHAQGAAAAAQIHGMKIAILMPADAPETKRRRAESYGAEIITYDRTQDDRDAIALDIARERDGVLVKPYDDAGVIAGQGSVGGEVAEDCTALGFEPDAMLVPIGGGGLIAGIALALEQMCPATDLYGVEPLQFDDHYRSLKSGRIERNAQTTGSICDALLSPSPGDLTFAINGPRLAGILRVGDDDVLAAMAYAFHELKLVVEPGGAVALAAILSGQIETQDRRTVIVLSGGNVDPAMMNRALDRSVAAS